LPDQVWKNKYYSDEYGKIKVPGILKFGFEAFIR
jgi:hypothetical protein